MGPFNCSLTFRNYGPNKASTSVGSSGLYFSIITSQLLVDPRNRPVRNFERDFETIEEPIHAQEGGRV